MVIDVAVTPEFAPFPKIARLRRDIVVTEKIDGTNAAVVVTDDAVYAQCRTRVITPQADNFGFALWVEQNGPALRDALGFGRHFGEWWGVGIQRGYGLRERRFSLFNVSKWRDSPFVLANASIGLSVVPVLYEGPFSLESVDEAVAALTIGGSAAAPGFPKPEGVVVFHRAANFMFKQTIEKDAEHKGVTP